MMLFKFYFTNNIVLSGLPFFFLIIAWYFLIPPVFTPVFNPITELVIPIKIPRKEAKVEIEIHLVIIEPKIRKYST